MNSGAGTKGTVGTPHNILTHTCARISKVENNETMGEEGDGGEE